MSLRIHAAFALGLTLAATATAQDDKVHGRLETIGSFRVLRVWGTAEEMGYAHG